MLKSQEHVMTEQNFLIWGQTHTIKFLTVALSSGFSCVMNNSSALHLRQAEIQLCERCSAMPYHGVPQ